MQEQTLPTPETQAQPAEPTGWQAPDFTVVDTAMEITAYALTKK
ncbi:pyrroloquinoline quinone precursor peptide PqqA [Streptomyces kunmingensis]|uniref:Coenzyme PQQ synthesis protein A n=1 Tax=Streptomyces kunmingensis TaxID=68225 RepID=A0ABU6CEN3_9ACTN|nr:pyrroloquinoline quinone precursor peptide PqqA [Streptomyces kunmingensis]MEB3963173.1 pyrroloquinoline quinone precursor peptide PqqA [Streptomyces kunmingensis]